VKSEEWRSRRHSFWHQGCWYGQERMKRFDLIAPLAIALLNGVLGCSAHYISSQVRQFTSDHHTVLSYLSLTALVIPPWFYLLAGAAVLTLLLRRTEKLSESALVSSMISLLWMLWPCF